MGFSRQEYWSGLSFPSPTNESYVHQTVVSAAEKDKAREGEGVPEEGGYKFQTGSQRGFL